MLLRVNNVEVRYSEVILVLRGISLEVGDRSIVCLLGSNGAGKTTTIKAISGLLRTELGRVTDGSIEFNGKRIDRSRPEEIVKAGIVQVMEGRLVFEHFTVEENLKAGAHLQKDSRSMLKDRDKVYSYLPRLKDLSDKEAGYLSGGEQQMLVIGRGLMSRPRLMLVDEPSLGLAPFLVREIYAILKRIRDEEGTSILLVEQNARGALSISDYGYVMENGKLVLDGPAEKLRSNEDVKEFYLGISQLGEKKSYRDVKHYRRRKRWLG